MGKHLFWGLLICSFFLLCVSAANWNILHQRQVTKSGLQITLKNYCESWRMNVELHNIRGYEVVPEECVDYIWKYMISAQYRVDSERTMDEIISYISTSCSLRKDGTDAWIFDVDDTLLSTIPYYKKNGFGGNRLNLTSLEEWILKAKAPVLDYSLKLFDHLKGLGFQIFLISSRTECLRSATTDNLVDVGYHGWASLILRKPEDENKEIEKYKADARKKLVNSGYHIWGILGDQWSSFEGTPAARRVFKLPNPLYYVA